MSVENTSAPAPESVEAQALAELEKEGHVVEGKEPAPEPIKDEPKKEEPPVTPKEEKVEVEEPKAPEVNRTPKLVEAWKIKVAEDQKDALTKEVAVLRQQVEELSKQKTPVTEAQQEGIADAIKKIAEGRENVDVELLTEFANTIISKTKSNPTNNLEETVKKLQAEHQLAKELNDFSNEFERDVLPLLADSQLTGDALSKLKESLKGYAFSDVYAKVPLKEIFAIKKAELNLPVIKKSSEGKAPKSRAGAELIDIDNISEDDFAKLPADKVEEFMAKKSEGSWQRR